MTEAVVEQVELETAAEEAFEFLSETENFCTFVRWAETSRRVDLSRSSWLLKGPEGATVEYEPELFSKCLKNYRNRWVHRGAPRGGEPDAILDRGELEFKRRPDGTTLLLLTYLADHADLVGENVRESFSEGGTFSDDRSAKLDLVVIVSHLFHPPVGPTADRSSEDPTATPIEPTSLRDRSTTPQQPEASEVSPASGYTGDLISLLDEWATEDPAYDEETLPALKENLDRNRPEYRKLFGHR